MKVKELIDFLKTFDQELEVICTRYSDYKFITLDEITLVRAIEQGDWIMSVHHKMSLEKLNKAKTYLHFAGN